MFVLAGYLKSTKPLFTGSFLCRATRFQSAQPRTQKASGRESRTADAVKTQMVGT